MTTRSSNMKVTIGNMKDVAGNPLQDITLEFCGFKREFANLEYVLYRSLCRPIIPEQSHFHSLSIAEKLIQSDEVTTRLIATVPAEDADIFISQSDMTIIASGSSEKISLDAFINRNLPDKAKAILGSFFSGLFFADIGNSRFLTYTEQLKVSFFYLAKQCIKTGCQSEDEKQRIVEMGRLAQREMEAREGRNMPHVQAAV